MKSRPLRGSSALPKRRGPCDAACGRGVPGTTSDAQPVLPVKHTLHAARAPAREGPRGPEVRRSHPVSDMTARPTNVPPSSPASSVAVRAPQAGGPRPRKVCAPGTTRRERRRWRARPVGPPRVAYVTILAVGTPELRERRRETPGHRGTERGDGDGSAGVSVARPGLCSLRGRGAFWLQLAT